MVMMKMTFAWRFIGSLLTLWMLTGCRTGPSHRPSFGDFQRAIRDDAAHTNLDEQVAVFEAAQLSNRELQKILRRDNAEELVGAGTQAHVNDPLGRELLIEATKRSPRWPVGWAALAYRDMSLVANQYQSREAVGDELTNAIKRWRSLEPTNAAPVYLAAEFECLARNVGAAKRLMVEADQKEGFETYTVAIQKCVMRAMETEGRSKYVARMCAMGQVTGVVGWSKLSKTILANSSADEQAVQSCFVWGARVGRGKSFLEQLVGDSIQARAMEQLHRPNFAAEEERIANRKARIKRAMSYTRSLEGGGRISEERWVHFLDLCFDRGEMPAVETLAAENGEPL
jgi:hypothetical protein